MRTLLLLSVFITLNVSAQIGQKYLSVDYNNLHEQGIITNVFRETPDVRQGSAVDTILGVIYGVKVYINNDDTIYWIDGLSTTYEPFCRAEELAEYWIMHDSIPLTYRAYYGRENVGDWYYYDGSDFYDVYEGIIYNKPAQIEFHISHLATPKD